MSTKYTLTVFYDGACPVCSREIAWYQRMTPQTPVSFVDVSQHTPQSVGVALSQCDALRRFHVMMPGGNLKNGAAAFAALWRCYPKLGWLGRLVALPGILHIAELSYRLFLKIRPTTKVVAQ